MMLFQVKVGVQLARQKNQLSKTSTLRVIKAITNQPTNLLNS